jgi:hypothetical protein
MPSSMRHLLRQLPLAAAIAWRADATAEDNLPEPKTVLVSKAGSSSGLDAILLPAHHYDAFWNNGDERYARAA